MAPPPPGVAPPPRLAFLGNQSPGRRKTLSPASSVQDNLDPRAMAQKPMSIAEAERMNLVAQDQIWRSRLKAENEAQQNWARNWGFLTTPLEELIECEDGPPTPKPRIELPQRFHIRLVTPVEKYIKVLPSPPVPKTTQGFIGWRSGVPGLNKCLEYGAEIRSCKGLYAKELGWPKQGIH